MRKSCAILQSDPKKKKNRQDKKNGAQYIMPGSCCRISFSSCQAVVAVTVISTTKALRACITLTGNNKIEEEQ